MFGLWVMLPLGEVLWALKDYQPAPARAPASGLQIKPLRRGRSAAENVDLGTDYTRRR